MQFDKDKIKKILITNLPAIIAILAMTVALKIGLNFNLILSFIVLSILYVLFGIGIEILLERRKEGAVVDYSYKTEDKKEDGLLFDKSFLDEDTLEKRKLAPSQNATELASRLKRTRLDLDQLFDMSSDEGEREESEEDESVTRVKVINDYSLLIERIKPKEKEVIDEVIEEEVIEEEKIEEDLEIFDDLDDFKIKSSEDLEDASARIKDEIDKRLQADKKTMVHHKKLVSLDEITFEKEETVKDIDLDHEDFKGAFGTDPIKNDDIDEEGILNSISSAMDKKEEAINDMAKADSKLISELYGSKKVKKKRKEVFLEEEVTRQRNKGAYKLPSLDLIKPSTIREKSDTGEITKEIRDKGDKLISTLDSFGVRAKIANITKGPSVTRYEIQPEPGIKVSRVVSLSDDIALSLAATGVRMEAPIPGKSAIGIEVPNNEIDTVYLYDVLSSSKFLKAPSNISIALGKDIAGNVIIGDVSRMPHLLIAGSTGSGKSVCINTIISSILYKASPDEVRFIMIDPKVVELGVYNGIPHLLIPVVTNPKKAASALAWAVSEVERRYSMFASKGVRDIHSYNKYLASKSLKEDKLNQIVIIIDELADLMMAAANDIEDSIIRIAQKARAAGIHLILATQRPSVNVITGLIKANIPSRIAFAVASQVDARTILDNAGAEKLLGRGDMLYHPLGITKPIRVQGAFVSDGDVERLVGFIKDRYGEAEYDEALIDIVENEGSKENGSFDVSDADEDLVNEAIELAFANGQLSASFLQRRLKVGYSRAARIIDVLENAGLISQADGSKPRELLLSKEEWESR